MLMVELSTWQTGDKMELGIGTDYEFVLFSLLLLFLITKSIHGLVYKNTNDVAIQNSVTNHFHNLAPDS